MIMIINYNMNECDASFEWRWTFLIMMRRVIHMKYFHTRSGFKYPNCPPHIYSGCQRYMTLVDSISNKLVCFLYVKVKILANTMKVQPMTMESWTLEDCLNIHCSWENHNVFLHAIFATMQLASIVSTIVHFQSLYLHNTIILIFESQNSNEVPLNFSWIVNFGPFGLLVFI